MYQNHRETNCLVPQTCPFIVSDECPFILCTYYRESTVGGVTSSFTTSNF